ncbi:D-glycero-beta-D-manno-heptose-7-phosphate kinase [Thermodesulfobacteriota bacterium]
MIHLLSNFYKCHVLVVGDLMVDEYIWGAVDRISPEAPVQVVSVNHADYTLGGAGNVVNNLVSLGTKVSAAGVIGTGANGRLLLGKFAELGVNVEGVIQETGRPTTKKTRIIAAHQHVLRIDWETKAEISDPTFASLIEFIEMKIPQVDAVLISDYGKGLLTDSVLCKLITFANKNRKITVVDPKGRDFSKYTGATLLTPNKKEAAFAAGIEILDETTLAEAGNRILNATNIDRLLITCGKDGMVLFGREVAPYPIKAETRQVYDVSGAGDTVVAVVGLAVASGASFEVGATLANTAAGIVVGKVGTATVSIKELETALKTHPDEAVLKHKQIAELPGIIQELRRKGKRLVLTNGCFDLLHVGHIKLFSASKQQGDVLIVAIDDDDSVRAIKGPGRPVIAAAERVRILSALDSVDYVVVFSSDELLKLIEIIRPDILAKGSNYSSEQVFGHELVEKYGGQVVLVQVTEDISSTRLINDIKNLT